MNILLSNNLESNLLENYQSLLKPFAYAGHNCMNYLSNNRAFDLWSEYKPNLFITKDLKKDEEKACKEFDTKVVHPTPYVCADVFGFAKPLVPTELDMDFFKTDYVSIINHSREEIVELKEYLGKGLKYKLFSPHRFTLSEYCGVLPQELIVAAVSCATNVVATNFASFFNYSLINENTIYPNFSKTEKMPREKVLEEHTAFSVANKFIVDNNLDIDINLPELYTKFKNEVGL